MHIQVNFKYSFLLCWGKAFISVHFFLLNGGTYGLTIGDHVKRFYFTGELGKLAYLPLGLVDYYPWSNKKPHVPAALMPWLPQWEKEKEEKKRNRKKTQDKRDTLIWICIVSLSPRFSHVFKFFTFKKNMKMGWKWLPINPLLLLSWKW